MNDEEKMPIVFHVFGHKSKQAYWTKSDFELMVVLHEQSVITAQAKEQYFTKRHWQSIQ